MNPTHERSSQKYHLHNYLNHSAIVQHYLTPFKKSARFASETESPSKVMKNPFYFILKALLVLKIFKILFDFLVRYKNVLIRKVTLISKFMTSQPGKQTIVILILPNVSIWKSKGNQTIKFGHLIEYYMRNIFIKKCGEGTIARSFSKKSKLSISLDQ